LTSTKVGLCFTSTRDLAFCHKVKRFRASVAALLQLLLALLQLCCSSVAALISRRFRELSLCGVVEPEYSLKTHVLAC
jgi:hypothetical protein